MLDLFHVSMHTRNWTLEVDRATHPFPRHANSATLLFITCVDRQKGGRGRERSVQDTNAYFILIVWSWSKRQQQRSLSEEKEALHAVAFFNSSMTALTGIAWHLLFDTLECTCCLSPNLFFSVRGEWFLNTTAVKSRKERPSAPPSLVVGFWVRPGVRDIPCSITV